ncbi:MAG: protein-L-isoaspartate(D-aspartate) O-methyltransferase [Planctomycetia bacterium]|nr:protein-L-isoaspartate(D-aspartate) O-methyltransferase [Planctomycetia bacterium]
MARNFSFLLAVAAMAACASPLLAQRRTPEQLRHEMVDEVIVAEGVGNQRVIQAMRDTPRHEFVPINLRERAYFDMALPIGESQTISPPYIVAYMTEQIDPQPEDKVLEIGTGSGYQAAVLSPLVKEVYTIEIVETLARRAEAAIKRLKYPNVKVKAGDGYLGWPEHAPFDKIIVTCSPEKVPQPLVDQLKEGGRMIIPLGERYQQTFYLFTKRDGKMVSEALLPAVFVPMTGKAESQRQVKPDGGNPKLVNAGFEEVEEKSGRAKGWYYQRQLTVVRGAEGDKAPAGERFVRFTNRELGRGAHVLQAMAVDGSKVRDVTLSCTIKGTNIRPGEKELACLAITFFDEGRKNVAETAIGNWQGTFDWRTDTAQIKVPSSAKEAIIQLGLLGATGELCVDDVVLRFRAK